jgi:hypothetical protein
LADTLVIPYNKIKLKISGDSLKMIRLRQNSGMRRWLTGLLVCALMIPGYSLYAMPSTQTVDNAKPPCHQLQDQEQIATQGNNNMDCCESLHQCNGNCDHDCSDCFSTGHLLGLIALPAELAGSASSHSLAVITSHNGLTPTLLLRPPCQFV